MSLGFRSCFYGHEHPWDCALQQHQHRATLAISVVAWTSYSPGCLCLHCVDFVYFLFAIFQSTQSGVLTVGSKSGEGFTLTHKHSISCPAHHFQTGQPFTGICQTGGATAAAPVATAAVPAATAAVPAASRIEKLAPVEWSEQHLLYDFCCVTCPV